MMTEGQIEIVCKIMRTSRLDDLAHRARERWERAKLWLVCGGLFAMIAALAVAGKAG